MLTESEKNIFTYWHQGIEIAPRTVQLCIKRVQYLHPDWNVVVLDKNNIGNYVSNLLVKPEIINELDIVKKSNIYRLHLLIEHGGVWVDATLFCSSSLDDFVNEVLNEGVFFFQKPGPDRAISSWFIAAKKNNKILSAFMENYADYWNNNNFQHIGHPQTLFLKCLNRAINRNLYLPHLWLTWPFTKILRYSPYFAFHYIFHKTVMSDERLANKWRRVPFVSAKEPHFLLRRGLNNPCTEEVRQWIDKPIAPVFKLSWKHDLDEHKTGTIIEYLHNKTDRNLLS